MIRFPITITVWACCISKIGPDCQHIKQLKLEGDQRQDVMILPLVDHIQTMTQASDLAIDWSNWQSEQNLSANDLIEWQMLFQQLADKFPELTDEFEENGII